MTVYKVLAHFADRTNIKTQNIFRLFWTAMTLDNDEVGDPIEGLGERLNRFKWEVKLAVFLFFGGYQGELELYRMQVNEDFDEYGNHIGEEFSYHLVEDFDDVDVVTLIFTNGKSSRVMFEKLDVYTATDALQLGYR